MCVFVCYQARFTGRPAISSRFFADKKNPMTGPTISKNVGPAMKFFFMKHVFLSSTTSLRSPFGAPELLAFQMDQNGEQEDDRNGQWSKQ